ncbi:hypothetical protein ACP70R_011507 [Stipagrostis hirtigluma subsp. patula]
MKQKIVIKVDMRCDKCRSKALGVAATTQGVESMGIEGEEKDQLVVVGDGVDATNLTSCLRKKVGRAQIVSVQMVAGAAEEAKPEDEAAAAVAVYPPQQWCPAGYYYPRPAVAYPYSGGHCYVEDSDTGSWCTIV